MSFVKKILFLRPFNQEETKGHSQSCLRIDTDAKRSSITVLGPTGQSSVFDFYNCYWSANDHSSLSEDIRQYAFQNVSRKFSTCVLLYGPMNTGKSYVLLGGPEHEGLLLTTLREVFTALPKQRVMLLVYEIDDETEQVFDLIQGELAASFHDVVQKRVSSFSQAINTLEDALSRRHASTHTFFTIKLSDKKTGQVVVMDFVLLENECKEKDYPSPRPSFCALHELIHSMGGKNEPDFSKCKLTEHFQEHFQNGRFRMIMLATVGPSAKDYEQIMRVLTYCTSSTVPRFSGPGTLFLPDSSSSSGANDVPSFPPPTPIRSSTHVSAPPPYLSAPPLDISHPNANTNNNTSGNSNANSVNGNNNIGNNNNSVNNVNSSNNVTNNNNNSSNNNINNNNNNNGAPPPPSVATTATILLTPASPIPREVFDSPLLLSGPGSPNSREFDALYRCVHKLTQLLEDYDRGVILCSHRSGIRSLFPSLTNTISERIQALEDCIMLADQCRMRASPNESHNTLSAQHNLFPTSLPSPVPTSHPLLPSHPFEGAGGGAGVKEQTVFTTLSRLGEVDAKFPALGTKTIPQIAKAKPHYFDVLLVEDVPVSSKLGLSQLKRVGYKPLSCENGSEAVAKFKSHWETLKFVLMDINMPEINGIQATEMIRKWETENRTDGQHVVIFGLTGNVDAKSLRTYRDCGMNGCIVKGSNLVEAMKKATQLLSETDSFVNLCNVEMLESPLLLPQPNPSFLIGSEFDEESNLRKTMVMRRFSQGDDADGRAPAAAPVKETTPPEPSESGSCPTIGTPNTSLSFRRLMAKKFVSKFGSADDELDLGEDFTKHGSPTQPSKAAKGLKKRKPFSLDDIQDIAGITELPPIPNMESKESAAKKENNSTTSPPPPPKGEKAEKEIIIDIPRPPQPPSSFKEEQVASPTLTAKSLLLKPLPLPDFAISPASAVPISPSGSSLPPSPPSLTYSLSGSPPPSSPNQSGPRASLHMKSAARKPTLLLVEDVKVSQKIGQAALTRANFKVAVAQNGEEAVEMFKKYHDTLEVVLMDVLMPPGMNGIEATYLIRQYEQENSLEATTVLGLTGNVDQANLLEYEKCGMNGCIVKGKHLEQAVNKVLSQLDESPAFVSYVS